MELKPCPFCGRDARVYLVDVTGCYDRTIIYNYQPGCETESCPGEYGVCSYETNDAAVTAWNTRATDPLLKEMAEALSQIVAEIKKHAYNPSLEHMGPLVLDSESVLQKYHEQESADAK